MENKTEKTIEQSRWGRMIPWALSISCVMVLLVIGHFLISNIGWYHDSVFELELDRAQAPIYHMHVYHLHMDMIKRSVGLFSGFTMMFLGLGVAFFSLRQSSTVGMQSSVWSANVATASPGIIALLVGGLLVAYSVGSKSKFAPFPVVYENKKSVEVARDSIKNEKEADTTNIKVVPSPFKENN